MNEPQARAIIEQVKRDYPGIIRATLEHSPKAKTGAVRVGLLLVAAQRRLSLRYPCQYQKALEAWQCFLLPEDEQERMVQQPIDTEIEEDEESSLLRGTENH
jgi:hypothetical protein